MSQKKRNAIVELIITLALGIWIIYRLAMDAMSYIDPGWHTTLQTPTFQKIKLIGLLLVSIGIGFRIVVLLRKIKEE